GSEFRNVAVTSDGSGTAAGVRLYVDGVARTLTPDAGFTPTAGPAVNTAPLRLGSGPGTSHPAGGRLDEVAYSDHLVTAAAVGEQYLAGITAHQGILTRTSTILGGSYDGTVIADTPAAWWGLDVTGAQANAGTTSTVLTPTGTTTAAVGPAVRDLSG